MKNNRIIMYHLLFLIFLHYSCSKGEKETEPLQINYNIPQGESPCTPVDNLITIEGNDHPPRMFTAISKREPNFSGDTFKFEAFDFGMKQIELTLHFNPKYKLTNPPPDGIYTTAFSNSSPVFNHMESDKVFVRFLTYDPIFYNYASEQGEKIYIKTLNGKMTATACNIKVIGQRNYTNYPAIMTFKAIEQ
jgi:hypothetical protein